MMRLRVAGFAALAALAISGCGGGSTHSVPVVTPTVTAVSPTNSATNVATNAAITATFSIGMNSSSLTTSSFTVTPQGGSAIAGAVSYSASTFTATFTPSASLTPGTLYTATVTTGAQSTANVGLSTNYTWTFTTAASA